MTPDPTETRATAERLAREVYKNAGSSFDALYPWLRKSSVDCALAGMAHRVRTAEREAAKKAWGAAWEWMRSRPPMGALDWNDARDRYIAAEFDAGERVTLSDGSVVTRRYSHIEEGEVLVHDESRNGRIYALKDFPSILRSVHTGADFDAVKRLAEQRGAER